MLSSWFRAGYEGFDDAEDYQRFLQQRDDDPNGSDGGGEEWSEDPHEQARLMRMGIDNRHNSGGGGGGGGGASSSSRHSRRQHRSTVAAAMGLNAEDILLSDDEGVGGGGYADEVSDEDDDDDDADDCGYYDEDDTNADALGTQPAKSRHFFNRSDNFEAERERRVASENAGHIRYEGDGSCREAHVLKSAQQKAADRDARRAMKRRLRAMEEDATTTTTGGILRNGGKFGLGRSGGIAEVYPKASRTSALSAYAVPADIITRVARAPLPPSASSASPTPALLAAAPLLPTATPMAATPAAVSVQSLGGHAMVSLPPLPSISSSSQAAGTLSNPIVVTFGGVNISRVLGPSDPYLSQRLAASDSSYHGRQQQQQHNPAAAAAPKGAVFLEGNTVRIHSVDPNAASCVSTAATSSTNSSSSCGGNTSALLNADGSQKSFLSELRTAATMSARGALPTGRFGHCLVALDLPVTPTLSTATSPTASTSVGYRQTMLLIGGCCDANFAALRTSIAAAATGAASAAAASNAAAAAVPTADSPSLQLCRAIVPRAVVSDPWLITVTAAAPQPPTIPTHSSVADAVASSQSASSQQEEAASSSRAESVAELCRRASKRSLMGSYLTTNDLSKSFRHGEGGEGAASAPVSVSQHQQQQQHCYGYFNHGYDDGCDRYGPAKEEGTEEGGDNANALALDSQESVFSAASVGALSAAPSSHASVASSTASAASFRFVDPETGRLMQRSIPSNLVDEGFANKRPTINDMTPMVPSSNNNNNEAGATSSYSSPHQTTQSSATAAASSPLSVDYRMVHSVAGDAPTPRCFATCLAIPSHWWGHSATSRGRNACSSSSSSSHTLLLYGGTYDGRHPIGWRKERSAVANGSAAVSRSRRSGGGESGERGGGESSNVFDHVLWDDYAVMTEQETDASDGEYAAAGSNNAESSAASVVNGDDANTTTTSTAVVPSRQRRAHRDRALASDELVLLYVDVRERAMVCEGRPSEAAGTLAGGSGSGDSNDDGYVVHSITSRRAPTDFSAQKKGQQSSSLVASRAPCPRFGHSAVLLPSTRKMCVFGGIGGLAAVDPSTAGMRYGRHRCNAAHNHNAAVLSLARRRPAALGDCWTLDLMTLRWQEVLLWHASPNPLPMPARAFHACAVVTDFADTATANNGISSAEEEGSAIGQNTDRSISASTPANDSLFSNTSAPSEIRRSGGLQLNATREHLFLIGGHMGDDVAGPSTSAGRSGGGKAGSSGEWSPAAAAARDVSALSTVCVSVGAAQWRPVAMRLPHPLAKGELHPTEGAKEGQITTAAAAVRNAAAALYSLHHSPPSLSAGSPVVVKPPIPTEVATGALHPYAGGWGDSSTTTAGCPQQTQATAARRAQLIATRAANNATAVGDRLLLLATRRALRPVIDDKGAAVDEAAVAARNRRQVMRTPSAAAVTNSTATSKFSRGGSSNSNSSGDPNSRRRPALSFELLKSHDFRSSGKNNIGGGSAAIAIEGSAGGEERNPYLENDLILSASAIEASRRRVSEMLSSGGEGSEELFVTTKAAAKKKRIRFEEADPLLVTHTALTNAVTEADTLKDDDEDEDGYVRPDTPEAEDSLIASLNCNNNTSNNKKLCEVEEEDDDAFDFDIPDVSAGENGRADEGTEPKATTKAKADAGDAEEDISAFDWDNFDVCGEANGEEESKGSDAGGKGDAEGIALGPRLAPSAVQLALRHRAAAALHGGYLQAVPIACGPIYIPPPPSSSSSSSSTRQPPLSSACAVSSGILILGGDASYDVPLATLLRVPPLYAHSGGRCAAASTVMATAPQAIGGGEGRSDGGLVGRIGGAMAHVIDEEKRLVSLRRRFVSGVCPLPQPSALRVFKARDSALLAPTLRALVAELLAEDDRWMAGITADVARRRIESGGVRSSHALDMSTAGVASTISSTHSVQQQPFFSPTDADATATDPSRLARYSAASRGLAFRPKRRAGTGVHSAFN